MNRCVSFQFLDLYFSHVLKCSDSVVEVLLTEVLSNQNWMLKQIHSRLIQSNYKSVIPREVPSHVTWFVYVRLGKYILIECQPNRFFVKFQFRTIAFDNDQTQTEIYSFLENKLSAIQFFSQLQHSITIGSPK